jgi:Spy/CpxP family protein refolding chaperone
MSTGGRWFVGALVALLVLATPMAVGELVAQSQQRGSEMPRQEMMNRIIQGFENRMVRELDLTSADMDRLREIFVEFRHERGELMRDRRELKREMARFAERGGAEAEAARLLQRQNELRVREVQIQQDEEAAMLEVLTPDKLIRFHKLRDDMTERIRELERRRGGGGGDEKALLGNGGTEVTDLYGSYFH